MGVLTLIWFCLPLFQTLSFALADKDGAKIILANDPDADRLAVAEKQERYGNKEMQTIYIFYLKARLIWGILAVCVAEKDRIVTVVGFGLKTHRNVRGLYEADHSGDSK